jgi:hypothetical protein
MKNKDYVILIMYNQSDAITYLKCKLELICFYKVLLIYLENMNLLNKA